MQSTIPERNFLAQGVSYTLRGDVAAAIAYNELTDGYGLEDAFEKLRPLMTLHQDGEPLPKRLDRRTIMDLLWSFTATWREDQGWEDSDELYEDPRKRDSFRRLKRGLGMPDVRRLPHVVVPLLLDTLLPPGDAGPETSVEAGDRQDTADQVTSTGI